MPRQSDGSEVPIEIFVSEEPPEVIIIERPVYIPYEPPAPQTRVVSGQQAVRDSNAAGIMQPSEYSHAAMIYDYHGDFVYQVYAQPLRVSAIRLEPGEQVVDTPFVSDSERWAVGAGVSYENGIPVQHIYIRPQQAPIQASLVINTNRRVYTIMLKSFQTMYMPMVRWRYPQTGLPNNFISLPTPGAAGGSVQAGDGTPNDSTPGINVDPRYLSFNYRVRYSLLRRPQWFPELVFDDGRQTYIVFPKSVLQAQFPTVFDDRRNVINHRVFEHVIIIDRLVEKVTLRLDRRQVVIEKKR
jgi:type IV secretion system protein VirB9